MEIVLVFIIFLAAVILFATERFPADVVAIMVLSALLVSGMLSAEQGMSGFSNPATITVAAMFMLSAGLQKTGAVQFIGHMLIRLGRSHWLLLMMVMVTVGAVSAFINNTAAVAVFLPLVLTASAARKFQASRLLIPLSFASQFGGVCTLIGTSTNLLVSSISEQAGLGAFSMFEFSQLGMFMFSAGALYFLLVGQWLLPTRRSEQLTENYQLGEYIMELRVMQGSSLINQTVRDRKLGEKYGVTVLEILRDQTHIWSPMSEPVRLGDILLVEGNVRNLMELKKAFKLEIEPEFKLKDEALKSEQLTLLEVLVAPRSRLIGQTLASLDFRRRYNALVLALQRREQSLREKLTNVRLRFGDLMLLLIPKSEIPALRRDENFIVMAEVEEPTLRRTKAPVALLVISLVVLAAALKLLPILTAAIVGCVAMTVLRCLTVEEAYRAIDWRVIVLLGGILPLGVAMEQSGAAKFITTHAMGLVGELGPIGALAAIYLLTAVLTECMSNNAAAVLLAPIAISTATSLGVDAKPFLMAVTFAASTSFATPFGYQTNTMVYNAGGYRFTDFMKVGIPLNLIFWALAVYCIPIFWPF